MSPPTSVITWGQGEDGHLGIGANEENEWVCAVQALQPHKVRSVVTGIRSYLRPCCLLGAGIREEHSHLDVDSSHLGVKVTLCDSRSFFNTLAEMSLLASQGFTKSLVMTVLSEIGDRTFCVAAILAMRYPRRSVLLGCLVSVTIMTIVSTMVGWAAPNLLSKQLAHYITTLLFFVFGLRSFWEGLTEDDDDNEELAEVEKELEKESSKPKKPFLTHFFSPVFVKAFSLTFFGEWGDKSQLATIGLAADEDPLGVVFGGILGQTLCTVAAVLGGKTMASQISEKVVTLLGGILFLIFGIQSLLSPVE